MIGLLLKLAFLKRLVLLASAGVANAPPAFVATVSAITLGTLLGIGFFAMRISGRSMTWTMSVSS